MNATLDKISGIIYLIIKNKDKNSLSFYQLDFSIQKLQHFFESPFVINSCGDLGTSLICLNLNILPSYSVNNIMDSKIQNVWNDGSFFLSSMNLNQENPIITWFFNPIQKIKEEKYLEVFKPINQNFYTSSFNAAHTVIISEDIEKAIEAKYRLPKNARF